MRRWSNEDYLGAWILAGLVLFAGLFVSTVILTAWAFDWDWSCVWVHCVKIKP